MKWWNKTALTIFCISLIVWASLFALRTNGALQPMELLTYDTLFRFPLRLATNSTQDAPIVLISETEADIKRYGYPLSDDVLAESLEKLLAAGVRVVGVDIYRDIPVAPGTERLNQVLTSHKNIIWIFYMGNDTLGRINPPAVLINSEQIGFNDMVSDPDDVSRRGLLFQDDKEGATHYAFPLQLALTYLEAEKIKPKSDDLGYLKLGRSTFLPLQPNTGSYADVDTKGYQFLITYPHWHTKFPTFTIADLLDGKVKTEELQDKIVLIGGMTTSLSDYKWLPGIDSSRYGVELHAHISDQIVQTALNDYPLMDAWSDAVEYSWLLCWCILGGIASFFRGGMWRLLLINVSGLLVLIVSAAWAFQTGLWLPLLSSMLAWVLTIILGVFWFSNLERNERKQLQRLFDQHVSPQVAATLWEKRDEFFVHGGVKPDQLTATVLFTDLVNFTTLAEGMNPLNLMNWLNEYMDEMSKIIIEQDGMINKYIGDAIMAVFGVPVKKTDSAAIAADAIKAVESAVRMSERLQELNTQWQQQDIPIIGMRVGIYTGQLVAGTLGGQQRMEYTVIGDTVNIASRLESFDKNIAAPNAQQPCRILVGESTWELIRDYYVTEQIAECQLKGKNNMLNIYQVFKRIIH